MADILWLPPVKSKKAHSISVMDAMEALVEWNRYQKPLYEALKRENNASYTWFMDVISSFNLASTFPKHLREDDTAKKKITLLLNNFRDDEHSTIDHVSVLAYELEKFTLYGQKKKPRNPLAAASLLMWFFNRDDILIYDQQSRKGLAHLIKEEDLEFEAEVLVETDSIPEGIISTEEGEIEGFELEIALPFDLRSYYDYHQCWIDMYLDRAAHIYGVCENLYELCDYEGMPSIYDYQCLKEEWFHRHVFATWLYHLTETLPVKRKT